MKGERDRGGLGLLWVVCKKFEKCWPEGASMLLKDSYVLVEDISHRPKFLLSEVKAKVFTVT